MDFAFTDTDSDDVLASVKLVTLPAAGSLALGGVVVTANDVVAVADIPRLVFTPAVNAHGTGYASFTFKVSDGVSESAVANTMTMDVTAVNDPASGLTITGTAREGQTLTADTSNIVDADGLTSPNYRYQWIRVDGGSETALGTASTHVVTSADEGRKLKVEVTLTDDDSNTETLEAETGTVSANAAPTSADRTVTMDEDTAHTFGSGDFAFVDTDSDDVLASVKLVTVPAAGQSCAGRGGGDDERRGGGGGHPQAGVHACGERARDWLRLVHVQGERRGVGERGGQHDDDGRDGGERSGERAGDHGDGAGGSDADGGHVEDRGCGRVDEPELPLPVDSGGRRKRDGSRHGIDACGDVGGRGQEAEGGGDADGRRRQHGDPGGRDGDGVRQRVADVGGRTVTTDEDTAYPFGPVDFAFTDTDSDDVLASVKLVTLPAVGSLALGGVPVRANQVIGTSDLGRLRFTPAVNAHGTGYASFTFRVSDGVSESASANTMTMDVTSVNDPASGLAITGTVRVGQTLTADTSKIVDADGLTSPNYRYQWIRVDGGSETALGTASTHVVTSADEGKKLKVEVTLTDDDGNTETWRPRRGRCRPTRCRRRRTGR